MSEKYIGIDLGSEFLKIAVHENNRICGEISERIPEQLRMDGKILSLESAAEFLKETGRKHGLSRYGVCVVLPEKQVITKRVRMEGMDPKHLILNLPYEFYDYLEHSVEEWVYDYSLADSIPDGTGQDETVVLLSKGEIDSKKVRVEFSLEDMDMSGFQKGATYEQIKAYVLEHTGLKVSSLYISQIKRKCGLDVGQNYNLSKKEDAKVPKCPPEKEAAIRDALKYFQMI